MNPIDPVHVETAIEAYGVAHTENEIQVALDRVQRHLASDLDDLVTAAYEGGDWYDETPNAYLIDLGEPTFWEGERGVFAATEIVDEDLRDVIAYVHRLQFEVEADVAAITDAEAPANPVAPVVVAKPPAWQAAERLDGRELNWLVEAGLTPAELLDYYKTEVQNWTAKSWAAVRDRDPDSIRQNARRAREKVAAHEEAR